MSLVGYLTPRNLQLSSIQVKTLAHHQFKMKLLIVLLIACCVFYTNAKPADDAQNGLVDIPDCHGVACPSGTVSCQISETSPKFVYCRDADGKALHSAPCPYENGHEHHGGEHHGDEHHGHHGH